MKINVGGGTLFVATIAMCALLIPAAASPAFGVDNGLPGIEVPDTAASATATDDDAQDDDSDSAGSDGASGSTTDETSTPSPTPSPSVYVEPTIPDSAGIEFSAMGSLYGIQKKSIKASTSQAVPFAYSAATFRKGVLPVAHLQKKVGTGWAETGISTPLDTDYPQFAGTIPAPDKSGKAKPQSVTYRLVVDDAVTPAIDGDVSSEFTIKYENPKTYTGLKKHVRTTIKKYCSSALVTVHSLPYGVATYRQGSYELEIAPSVRRLGASEQKRLALYACAKFIQWKAYGATLNGAHEMGQDAAKAFGSRVDDPETHLANCMVTVVLPKAKFFRDKGCSAKDIRISKRVLKGHRL